MKIIDSISDEHLRRIAESKDTGTCRARIRAAIRDVFSERAALTAAPAGAAEPVNDDIRKTVFAEAAAIVRSFWKGDNQSDWHRGYDDACLTLADEIEAASENSLTIDT